MIQLGNANHSDQGTNVSKNMLAGSTRNKQQTGAHASRKSGNQTMVKRYACTAASTQKFQLHQFCSGLFQVNGVLSFMMIATQDIGKAHLGSDWNAQSVLTEHSKHDKRAHT